MVMNKDDENEKNHLMITSRHLSESMTYKYNIYMMISHAAPVIFIYDEKASR